MDFGIQSSCVDFYKLYLQSLFEESWSIAGSLDPTQIEVVSNHGIYARLHGSPAARKIMLLGVYAQLLVVKFLKSALGHLSAFVGPRQFVALPLAPQRHARCQ